MVENRHWFFRLLPHVILCIGVFIVAFPVYVAFVGSTLDAATIANGQMGLLPGSYFFENYYRTLFVGTSGTTRQPVFGIIALSSPKSSFTL